MSHPSMSPEEQEEMRMVYDALSVRELREMLGDRGLPSDGAVEKRDLIDRLLGVVPPPSAATLPAGQHTVPGGADGGLVAEFCQVTGADPDTAAQFLEMMGGDLDSAINMFLETGASGRPSRPADSSQPSQPPPGPAMASHHMGGEDGDVRAPLPTMKDTLLGGSGSRGGHVMDTAMGLPGMSSIAALLNPALRTAGAGPVFGGVAGGGDDEKLEWMFKVPDGMSCPATFQETRNMCKEAHKWLLVNIQDHENFASHRLNRDVWRDETIQMLVESGFVFWQRNRTSQEGQTFISRYNVELDHLPVIAIVDPRTGGKVREWAAAQLKAVDVSNFLTDFLDQNQLDSLTAPKVRLSTDSKRSSGGDAAFSGASANPTAGQDDEEAEMARAIAMSMADQGAAMSSMPMPPPPASTAFPPPAPPVPSRAYVELPPEPPEGTPPAEVAKVQFRLADGTKFRRSFFKTNKVAVMFAYIEKQCPDLLRKFSAPDPGTNSTMAVHDYDLLYAFPHKSLEPLADAAIGDTDVAGAVVTVRLLN